MSGLNKGETTVYLDEAVVKLADGRYLHIQFGDSEEVTEGCDAYIDYTVFEADMTSGDGAQLDYNSEKTNYTTITDAIADIIDFAYDGQDDKPQTWEMTSLEYCDLVD